MFDALHCRGERSSLVTTINASTADGAPTR
jgi:hypothetical protein